jgi:hypothetical protein
MSDRYFVDTNIFDVRARRVGRWQIFSGLNLQRFKQKN